MPEHVAKISCRCGTVYERKLVDLPIKDVGEFLCETCGALLESWRGRQVPAFTHIKSTQKR